MVYLVGLVILWVLVSIPVYFAGKLVKGERATFGSAMAATLGGVVAYYIVFFVVAAVLGALVGPSAGVFALILGFLAWLSIFKSVFGTSWPGALGIVVLAWVILTVLDIILVHAFGVRFPKFYPF